MTLMAMPRSIGSVCRLLAGRHRRHRDARHGRTNEYMRAQECVLDDRMQRILLLLRGATITTTAALESLAS